MNEHKIWTEHLLKKKKTLILRFGKQRWFEQQIQEDFVGADQKKKN